MAGNVARVQETGPRAPAPGPLGLVQDLANTLDVESDDDALRTPADLAAFASTHGLDGLTFGAPDLARVRELREALRDACSAHAGPDDIPEHSAAALDRLLADAPLTLTVAPSGAAALRPSDGLTGAAALTAHVAAAIAAAAADGTWQRLKACAADTCRWVYYDRSPAGRGRWCTMAVCGSRAKMRAYRGRRSGGG
jgi:predicted RNA-binding Zn ribbon-like protein